MTETARRALSAGQLTFGLATLIAPARMTARLTPDGSAVPDLRIVRVLGARQALQGVVGLRAPGSEVLALGSVVDALHAASLLPLIAFSPRYRPAALASGGLAGLAAAAGAILSRRPG